MLIEQDLLCCCFWSYRANNERRWAGQLQWSAPHFATKNKNLI